MPRSRSARATLFGLAAFSIVTVLCPNPAASSVAPPDTLWSIPDPFSPKTDVEGYVFTVWSDSTLHRYNPDGILSWTVPVTVDGTLGLELGRDGNVYVASPNAPPASSTVSKYDTTGTMQWQVTLPSLPYYDPTPQITTSEGGYTYTVQGLLDCHLCQDLHEEVRCYSPQGQLLSTTTLNNSGGAYILGVDREDRLVLLGFKIQRGEGGAPAIERHLITTSGSVASAVVEPDIAGGDANYYAIFLMPYPALDPAGNIYVFTQVYLCPNGACDPNADNYTTTFKKITATGSVGWSREVDETAWLTYPSLKTSGDSLLYLEGGDTNGLRQLFASDGGLQWEAPGVGLVCVLANSDIVVAGNQGSQSLTVDGAPLWSLPGSLGRLTPTSDGGLLASGNSQIMRLSGPDIDGDGLPDLWEKSGIPAHGLLVPYTLKDAAPRHKDLYVEVDAMDSLGPSQGALNDVVAAFAKAPVDNPDNQKGIRLHIVGKTGCDPCVDEDNIAVASWPVDKPGVYFRNIKENQNPDLAGGFGTESERRLPSWQSMQRAKSKAFRYCIFANWFGANCPPDCWSGVGELPGNDFTVTLGLMHPAATRQEQAGTFMHELGHTLGLMHGGMDHKHRKPNYKSVMNYLWQMPTRVNPTLSKPAKDALANYQNSFRLDYSTQPMPTLFETALDESQGIGGDPSFWVPVGPQLAGPGCSLPPSPTAQIVKMSGWVDWNRNGTRDDSLVCADVNFIPGEVKNPSPGEPLVGEQVLESTDWQKLQYLPRDIPDWTQNVHLVPRLREDEDPLAELTLAEFDSLGTLRFDCNGNGIFDDEEIEAGTTADGNGNGIPDGCETLNGTAVSLSALPHGIQLSQATPNPFNPWTRLRFYLDRPMSSSITIYDVQGRVVRRLLPEAFRNAGWAEVRWDGKSDAGVPAGSGVYFVQLRGDGKTVQQHVVLVK